MSNARAFRRTRRREVGRVETAWMPAWASTDEGALDEAKQATHDDLIAMLGHRRRSGVSWGIYDVEKAEKPLSALFDGATPEMSDYLRRIRALLREHGGYFVVAMADGVR